MPRLLCDPCYINHGRKRLAVNTAYVREFGQTPRCEAHEEAAAMHYGEVAPWASSDATFALQRQKGER